MLFKHVKQGHLTLNVVAHICQWFFDGVSYTGHGGHVYDISESVSSKQFRKLTLVAYISLVDGHMTTE